MAGQHDGESVAAAAAPRPAAARVNLGISLNSAAKVIGVSRGTLTLYEIRPSCVGDDCRARIDAFYTDLAWAYARAVARPRGRRRSLHTAGAPARQSGEATLSPTRTTRP